MAEQEGAIPAAAALEDFARDKEIVGAPVAIPPTTRSERARKVIALVLMLALALLYIVPLAWTFITSLKTQAEASAGFDLWPANPSLDAYREIWNRPDLSFVTFFKNSALFAASITVINVFFGSLGGYAFARLKFPLREPLFLLVLATLIIPDQLRLVPVYLMMIDFPVTNWNLVGTREGYIFFGTSIALATNLFLMRQYFLTIPKDYEEACEARRGRLLQDVPPSDAAAGRAGARRRRDPHVPGHLERVLLGEPVLGRARTRVCGRCRSGCRSSDSSTRPSGPS
jgi:hypothetical protein